LAVPCLAEGGDRAPVGRGDAKGSKVSWQAANERFDEGILPGLAHAEGRLTALVGSGRVPKAAAARAERLLPKTVATAPCGSWRVPRALMARDRSAGDPRISAPPRRLQTIPDAHPHGCRPCSFAARASRRNDPRAAHPLPRPEHRPVRSPLAILSALHKLRFGSSEPARQPIQVVDAMAC
jgi:hypothetical protein